MSATCRMFRCASFMSDSTSELATVTCGMRAKRRSICAIRARNSDSRLTLVIAACCWSSSFSAPMTRLHPGTWVLAQSCPIIRRTPQRASATQPLLCSVLSGKLHANLAPQSVPSDDPPDVDVVHDFAFEHGFQIHDLRDVPQITRPLRDYPIVRRKCSALRAVRLFRHSHSLSPRPARKISYSVAPELATNTFTLSTL